MSDRYALQAAVDRLRATLAKAERTMPLSQPVRSRHLYDDTVQRIDELTEQMRARVVDAGDKVGSWEPPETGPSATETR